MVRGRGGMSGSVNSAMRGGGINRVRGDGGEFCRVRGILEGRRDWFVWGFSGGGRRLMVGIRVGLLGDGSREGGVRGEFGRELRKGER